MMKQIFFALLLVVSTASYAQINETSIVFKALQERDSLVFNEGFNKCNTSVYDSIISDDIEFYHDKGGVTKGKAAFIASVKNNICGSQNKMRRELVKQSLEVFLLKNNDKLYGAIQNGVHKFFVLEKGNLKHAGTAKFTHLWLLENDKWKLKRVLSYDHF